MPLLVLYVGSVTLLAGGPISDWSGTVRRALPAGGLLLLAHLVQDLIPRDFKEMVVFFRREHRLPGHRAFTEVCRDDPRIPSSYLDKVQSEKRMGPADQNAAWYQQYTTVSSTPSVAHSNFRYIAWRDATVTLLLLALVTPTLGAFETLSWTEVLMVSGSCIGLAILTGVAARNTAVSLVRNVVAAVAANTSF